MSGVQGDIERLGVLLLAILVRRPALRLAGTSGLPRWHRQRIVSDCARSEHVARCANHPLPCLLELRRVASSLCRVHLVRSSTCGYAKTCTHSNLLA